MCRGGGFISLSITFQDYGSLRKISVLGNVESQDDIHLLLAACDTDVECEVNFFDAHTIPAPVVVGLANCLDRGRRILLRSYKGFLLHYLARLGLPVVQVRAREACKLVNKLVAVAIGGSAASLPGILYLIEHLPYSEIVIFIVQHIPAEQPSRLDALLRVRTNYEVLMPSHVMTICTGTIYIAPPGHHLKVANGLTYVTQDRKNQFARPSLDTLFASVAHEYGPQALGVLLCGFGQDGVQGCMEIRRYGGLVLLQEPVECGAAGVLPLAARAAVAYDYTLNLPEITCFLASYLVANPHTLNGETMLAMGLFLEAIQARYGYDFRDYQPATVQRRMIKLAYNLGDWDFCQLQREILTDPIIFERFLLELSINVTSFFRHPEQFRLLREEILPYLNSFPLLKIWSAGCATGEEIYSLAILVEELGMLHKTYLFATDINAHVLKVAESGLFSRTCLDESQANYQLSGGKGHLTDFMGQVNIRFVKLSERFNKHIFFHHHSLVHSGVFNEFQLILCRNVLIYFTPKLQQQVVGQLSQSLHHDGFLLTGPSEPVVGDGLQFFRIHNETLRCYRLTNVTPVL